MDLKFTKFNLCYVTGLEKNYFYCSYLNYFYCSDLKNNYDTNDDNDDSDNENDNNGDDVILYGDYIIFADNFDLETVNSN